MSTIVLCFGVVMLILDAPSALLGAREGLELCVKTVIPSLMPFFFLSVLLTNRLMGKRVSVFRPIGTVLRLPEGAESIFLMGVLGGYPVGAQAVAQAKQSGHLDGGNAARMLGFCSNAGPSFIFGILGGMFTSPAAPWLLWIIHILSAMIVGFLLPGDMPKTANIPRQKQITPAGALERTVKIMAAVCGWVILFRVLIAFMKRWFLWLLPNIVRNIVIGILELTNGCCMLGEIENEGLRFILASCFLACGGCCVTMQTMGVTEEIGSGMYFPGKLMQTGISFLLAFVCQSVLLSGNASIHLRPIIMGPVTICLIVMVFYLRKQKNNSSIPFLSGV